MTVSRRPRVLFAGLFHETHTFVGGLTTLADCIQLEGAAMMASEDETSPLGGALAAARKLGWDIIPSLDLRAIPGPIVADDVVAFWWERVAAALSEALRTGLDGIFLILHGAMVSQSLLDVEGEMLARIRAMAGPELPIGGVTDLHANFSAQMAQHSSALVTYRENPHTDGAATGQRAALLLDYLMDSNDDAVTVWQQTPILWPPTGTSTGDEPMRLLEELARRIEASDPEILAVNIHAGYAFADVPDVGVSFSAVTVGARRSAESALQRLADLAWEKREAGNVIEPGFDAVLPVLRGLMYQNDTRPIVLTEPSENIGGGAAGDGTGLLRCLIARHISNSVVVLNDPQAVAQLQTLRPSQFAHLLVGGRVEPLPGAGPLELDVELMNLTDGRFTLEDPQSHLSTMYGQYIEMGPCALVRHRLTGGGEIRILLTSRKTPPFDLGQLRSQGIVPENTAVIGVKAAVAHRRAYNPIARAEFAVSTPGPCTSDLRTLPFRNVRRPLFPLDDF